MQDPASAIALRAADEELLATEPAAADAMKPGIVARHLVGEATGLVVFMGADADARGVHGKCNGAIASVHAPGAPAEVKEANDSERTFESMGDGDKIRAKLRARHAA